MQAINLSVIKSAEFGVVKAEFETKTLVRTAINSTPKAGDKVTLMMREKQAANFQTMLSKRAKGKFTCATKRIGDSNVDVTVTRVE